MYVRRFLVMFGLWLLTVSLCVLILFSAGCKHLTSDMAKDLVGIGIAELFEIYNDYKEEAPPADAPDEYKPEPALPPWVGLHPQGRPIQTNYEFQYADGGRLYMTDYNQRDHWSVDAKRVEPDGAVSHHNVNERVRKIGVRGRAMNWDKQGTHYYWITPDAKAKKVSAFTTGYQPQVERGIDGYSRQNGWGNITNVIVKTNWM